MLPRLLPALLAGLLLLPAPARATCPAIALPAEMPAAAVAAPRPPPWLARVTRMNRLLRRDAPKVLFLGDSITARWDAGLWERHFVPRAAANLGIDGDRTEHLLWRLDHGHLDGISPRLVVLMIGSNNAAAGHAPADIAVGVAAILQLLAERLPEAKVLLLGVFPSGATPDDRRRRTSAAASRLFAACADGERIHYMDLAAALLEPDGRLSREVAPDLLHLSAEGYRRWAEAVLPVVERLLAPGPAARP